MSNMELLLVTSDLSLDALESARPIRRAAWEKHKIIDAIMVNRSYHVTSTCSSFICVMIILTISDITQWKCLHYITRQKDEKGKLVSNAMKRIAAGAHNDKSVLPRDQN